MAPHTTEAPRFTRDPPAPPCPVGVAPRQPGGAAPATTGAPAARPGPLRLAGTVVAWAIAAAALTLVVALVAPLAFHMRPLVVLSGSMDPVLQVGDVTVVQRIAPAQARVGDVVTFRDPATDRLTTHRVRATRRAARRVHFVTKGDANNAVERWSLPATGEMSRAVYRVPLVGHVASRIRTPAGWALLVGLPLLLLAGHELRRIWAAPEGVGHARAA